MLFIAINGSPRGGQGNTDVLVQALLKGAAAAGARTVGINLVEHRIEHCRGCHSCWSATPGRCVIQDDMAAVLGRIAGRPAEHDGTGCAPEGAGLIALASPVHLANVSGTLKDFIDRLTVLASPHGTPCEGAPSRQPAEHPEGARRTAGATGAPAAEAAGPRPAPARFVMASTCGYPGTGQFDVISLWIRRFAAMMGTAVAAEVYSSQGKALRAPTAEQRSGVEAYLSVVEAAGAALARGESLAEPELAALRAGFGAPAPA
jgi:multimeric flavodoxin WrbA